MAAACSYNWSELHPNLLVQIFSRLQLVDFIRAAAACRSWRQLKLRSKDFHVGPNNQIPWLMLSSPSPSQTQSRYFHSLLPSSGTHLICLTEIAGLSCMGSSQGFLISHDKATTYLRAVNPVTGELILLPPTSTIPEFWFMDTDIPDFYFIKAILSPDIGFGGRPRTAAVIYSNKDLAFARPGDGKWTLIANFRNTHAILFHKNMLYAVAFTGPLAAFDLWDPSVPYSHLCEGLPIEKINHFNCYLVESPDGNNLYYVTRYVGPDGDGDDDDNMDRIYRTTNFRVYKLDELERQWIEVNTLGNLALFLGFNHPVALSAMEHPSIKGNSIYFTDDGTECYFDCSEFARWDMGVFDLGDGSIQPLSLSDDLMCLKFDWPPPIWFTPAL